MKTLVAIVCLALSAAGASFGRDAKCPECKGVKWVYESVECDKCRGSGQVEKRIWGRHGCGKTVWVRCPKCSRIGSGAKLGMIRTKVKCPACSGTGKAGNPDPAPEKKSFGNKKKGSGNGR